jgi:hypothetical protein
VDIDVKLDIQQITVTKRGRPDRRVAFCMRDFGGLGLTSKNKLFSFFFSPSVLPVSWKGMGMGRKK